MQEELKHGITTVVGAALGEQQCWERTACKAGELASALPGKDVLFIVLDRLAPSNWLNTIENVKNVSIHKDPKSEGHPQIKEMLKWSSLLNAHADI